MPDYEMMVYEVVLPVGGQTVAVPSGWEPFLLAERQGNKAQVVCRRVVAGTGAPLVIDSLNPASLPGGTVALTVEVLGSGFDPSCTVTVDDLAVTTFYVDAGHLEYTARADLASPGDTHNIMVVNGADQVSNTVTFTYT